MRYSLTARVERVSRLSGLYSMGPVSPVFFSHGSQSYLVRTKRGYYGSHLDAWE